MMAKVRTWIDAMLLAFDAKHLEAHRERQEPAAHPVDCACHRCDETEPEPRKRRG